MPVLVFYNPVLFPKHFVICGYEKAAKTKSRKLWKLCQAGQNHVWVQQNIHPRSGTADPGLCNSNVLHQVISWISILWKITSFVNQTRVMLSMGKYSQVPNIVVAVAIPATIVAPLVLMPMMMYASDAKLRRHVIRAVMETSFGYWLKDVWKRIWFGSGNNVVHPIH